MNCKSKIFLFTIILIQLISCKDSNKLFSESYKIKDYEALEEWSQSFKNSCDLTLEKNLSISHPDLTFKNKRYVIYLSINGYIHSNLNLFNENIKIKYCDYNELKFASIIIRISDLKSKKMYKWENKSSYDLTKIDEIKIQLKTERLSNKEESDFTIEDLKPN